MEKRKVKFLVLGATGMAGHVISLYLHEQGHDVTAFLKNGVSFCKNINGNAMDKEFITSMLQDGDYDVVINCIGVLNQACDKEPANAVYLNSYLPQLIADTIREKNVKLIQMSTDCIFSGKAGPYSEKSFPEGDTFYDRTKALGEIIDNKNLTFRNSIIGPDMKKEGIGLFNWFMQQEGIINGYTKAMWTGVSTLTLAKAMEKVSVENVVGIYQLVNNESISKFNLLTLFNKYMKNGRLTIQRSEAVNLNKSLINNRTDFSFEVPTYEQMVIEMRDWIYSHRELYPHYFK